MKKTLFSFLFVSAFVVQALYQHVYGAEQATNVVAPAATTSSTDSSGGTANTSSASAPPPTVAVSGEEENEGSNESGGEEGSASASTPTPAPVPTPTPTPTVAAKPSGQYVDGTYTGNAYDAYYGTIQVKAIVTGGKLSDVQFLQYPSDRSTSRQINYQAMPYLKQEAITAQSASVNVVSGATYSSTAFRLSLASALAKAKA